jgi:hypothetical protein
MKSLALPYATYSSLRPHNLNCIAISNFFKMLFSPHLQLVICPPVSGRSNPYTKVGDFIWVDNAAFNLLIRLQSYFLLASIQLYLEELVFT